MRIIPNQYEKRYVTRLMKSDLIRVSYPNESEPIRNQVFNPNHFELGLIHTEFSIRINPNHSDLGFIRIRSDWKFGLDQSELGWIRIHSDSCLGLNRIRSYRFFTIFHQTSYKTFYIYIYIVIIKLFLVYIFIITAYEV